MVNRVLVGEVHPVRTKGRHHVKIYDIFDEEGKYLGVSYTIISQKHDANGNLLDEWFINIHPAEIDDVIGMLAESKRKGATHLFDMALNNQQANQEKVENERDGRGDDPSGTRLQRKGDGNGTADPD